MKEVTCWKVYVSWVLWGVNFDFATVSAASENWIGWMSLQAQSPSLVNRTLGCAWLRQKWPKRNLTIQVKRFLQNVWCFASWNSGSWTLISKQSFPLVWVTPGGFSNKSRTVHRFPCRPKKLEPGIWPRCICKWFQRWDGNCAFNIQQIQSVSMHPFNKSLES